MGADDLELTARLQAADPAPAPLAPRRPAPPPAPPPQPRPRTAPLSDSFRRSEASLAGQIARAAARGQRVL